MDCSLFEVCGGCSLRNMPYEDYQKHKITKIKQVLQSIDQNDYVFNPPIFIQDNTRRRASLSFARSKGKVLLGFNANKSNEIVGLNNCLLLTPKINQNLDFLHLLIQEICNQPIIVKTKKKKTNSIYIDKGNIWVTEAENGLDIVLEFAFDLSLDIRQIIFEHAHNNPDVVRVSHRFGALGQSETILEKSKVFIKIAQREVYVPAGTFLQPSKQGEQSLLDLVESFLGTTSGKIADLFCGVGTFSYLLCQNINNKIVAIDSSAELLSGFEASVNQNMIPNIKIINKNLFKYPLDEQELKGFDVVVFDPPRAGAKEQVAQISKMQAADKPQKIIAVSCNPVSFVRDANILIMGGYALKQVTMVDQFIYSNHSELVALFEKL